MDVCPVEKARAGSLDQGRHTRPFVRRQVVHDHDVAGPQLRDEHACCVGLEGETVDCAVEHKRRHDAAQAKGPQLGSWLSSDHAACADAVHAGTTARVRHFGRGAGLIDESCTSGSHCSAHSLDGGSTPRRKQPRRGCANPANKRPALPRLASNRLAPTITSQVPINTTRFRPIGRGSRLLSHSTDAGNVRRSGGEFGAGAAGGAPHIAEPAAPLGGHRAFLVGSGCDTRHEPKEHDDRRYDAIS